MLRSASCVVATLLFTHAAANAEPPIKWAPLFVGVDHTEWKVEQPVLMHADALRIDRSAPGVRVFTTPANGDEPLETNGCTTTAFLARRKLQVAMNTHFFGPCCKKIDGEPKDLIGLAIHNGTVVSPPGKWHAVLFMKSGAVEVRPESPTLLDEIDPSLVAHGLCGELLMTGGELLPAASEGKRHPRSAIGFSADRRTCYLMAIDGRRPGHSLGATLRDVAEQLAHLGAAEAFNVDGGGSTTLVAAGANGTPNVLNVTSAEERVVASHLGFFAKPLEDSAGQ
ncbi:MAG: phosphodiester glycosidase family protein [Planctomycetota bacterium]